MPMLSFAQFMDTVGGMEEARVLLAALETRIFTVLEKKNLTARQIASRAKTDADGTLCLLNALAAMGALRVKSAKYSSAPDMYKYFCETSLHYKKGTVHLMGENHDEWAQLLKAIRKGRDPKEYEDADNPGLRRLFTHAMHERSEPFANKIAEIITRKPAGRFLDLGSGPGTYSAAVLKKDKKAQATLLDRSSALKVAQDLHGKSSVWSRMELRPGDLFSTPFGDDFDTIFYSNILHIYSPQENKQLLLKMKNALVKGGRLVLVDYFHTRDATQPYEAALFGVTMLMFTATGKTYSYDETEKLLSQTGFHKFRRIPLGDGNGMLVAFKK